MIDKKLAAVLSFFIPGLGQGLCGNLKKGIVFFIIAIALNFIIAFYINNRFGSVIQIAYSLYAAYDAYRLANV